MHGIVARQCVAMSHPPEGAPGGPVERERIPQTNMAPFNLTQSSPHLNNLMFGGIERGDDEHGFVPICKVGQAETTTHYAHNHAKPVDLMYNADDRFR
jgi:hypothetical protein